MGFSNLLGFSITLIFYYIFYIIFTGVRIGEDEEVKQSCRDIVTTKSTSIFRNGKTT